MSYDNSNPDESLRAESEPALFYPGMDYVPQLEAAERPGRLPAEEEDFASYGPPDNADDSDGDFLDDWSDYSAREMEYEEIAAEVAAEYTRSASADAVLMTCPTLVTDSATDTGPTDLTFGTDPANVTGGISFTNDFNGTDFANNFNGTGLAHATDGANGNDADNLTNGNDANSTTNGNAPANATGGLASSNLIVGLTQILPPVNFPRSALNGNCEQDPTVHELLVEYEWPSLAKDFLGVIPQGQASWERRLPQSHTIWEIIEFMSIPGLPTSFNPSSNWDLFFDAALDRLEELQDMPSVASLFSIVLVAATQVALIDQCSEDIIDETLRSVLELRGVPIETITKQDTMELRLGVLNGIDIIDECIVAIGPRANEFPLYCTGALELFRHCTPRCFEFIMSTVSSIRAPSKRIALSANIGIPNLVFEMLGSTNFQYNRVSDTLRFNGVECESCQRGTLARCTAITRMMNTYPARRYGWQLGAAANLTL
ncbi:hypothetical protein AK830_g11312 [Neonectria ditissima]|uniref:Uncharacterized protein n=1 Tax=Neonectria ditissima TaxID=78410 RepID=A0A0P7AMT7_9HYPO|nr:hypothetical protein AK830_g11312 [Neonectria ditissima]